MANSPVHGKQTGYDIHTPWTWEVNDSIARLALNLTSDPRFKLEDLTNKVCLQKDNNSLWLLVDPLVPTWVILNDSTGGVAETFTNTNPTPNTVGGIASGSTFSNKTMVEMWNSLLYPELFPTLTNPSNTFTLTQSGLQEVGVVLTLNFASTFNRGVISPAYGTSGFRSGLPSSYVYSGTGLTTTPSTVLTNNNTVNSYTVLLGNQTWTGYVSYRIGEQPLSSKGNNYSTPLSAGDTGIISRTITGVYPWYYNSVSLTVSTKQTLANHGSLVTTSFLAEDGVNKQFVEFPDAWGNITSIRQYNTLSGQWDSISLNTFTKTSIQKIIQGNTIDYNKYEYSGNTIGARQIRWYV